MSKLNKIEKKIRSLLIEVSDTAGECPEVFVVDQIILKQRRQ